MDGRAHALRARKVAEAAENWRDAMDRSGLTLAAHLVLAWSPVGLRGGAASVRVHPAMRLPARSNPVPDCPEIDLKGENPSRGVAFSSRLRR
jgi:hypothetical protein